MKSAQEAYQEVISSLKEVNIDAALKMAEEMIERAIKERNLATYVGPFSVPIAEKLSIELERHGYNSCVIAAGKFSESGMPLVNISINFKWLPAPSRESYVE